MGNELFGWLSDIVATRGLFVGLIAIFFGGLALNLTPCVYPMIPVTLAFFSSQASGSSRRLLSLALSYVLGIALSYAALGTLATQTGGLLGAWLQQPVVLIAVAAIVFALALSMFGLYELRLPQAWMNRFATAGGGWRGAFVMGLVIGLVAAPCVGPFILGLLLVASRLENPWIAFLLFFVMGLGMGLPYIFLGMLGNRAGRLPRAGVWLVWVKQLLGWVLIGLALYFLRPLLSDGAVKGLTVALLASAGLHLGWSGRRAGKAFAWLGRVAGVALVASAICLAWPRPQAAEGVRWTAFTRQALDQAAAERKPVVIDTYADWCIPCVELDHVTFGHPDVIAAMSGVTALRIDATREVSAEAQALFDERQVLGVPTVMFFDRAGKEREDLRLLGFETPADFIQRLRQVRGEPD